MSTKVANDTSKRRRFQPPITTFFSTSSTSTPSSDANDLTNDDDITTPRLSHYHYSAATFSPTPVVPAKVQSSLLNVGMRVRKSVAEGYKTKKAEMMTLASAGAGAGASAELAPFCGSSKMGDFGVEPFSRPVMGHDHSNNDLVNDEADAFSLPSSSKESTASSSSSSFALNVGQKRSFDYSDDDDLDEFDFADQDIDPSHGYGYMGNTAVHTQRTILAPTLGQQRRRFIATKNYNNQSVKSHMDVEDDFEEASFLCRREDVEMDGI